MKTDPRISSVVAAWISRVLDAGWTVVEDSLSTGDPLGFPGYATGSESVVCATGTAGGYPAEAIAFDFEAFGGSLGVVAGERIARAFERAVVRRAGVVALTATGGARMQEGMAALVQMAKTVVARQTLAKHALPFAAYLRNPTTGGVYASFAGLADVIWAEPGATIGFAGPRVAEALGGRPLPEGSHTAEFALDEGLVDGIVAPDDLAERVRTFLSLTIGDDAPDAFDVPASPAANPADPWSEVELARHPRRPTGRAFAERIATDLVPIVGDRAGTSDTGCLMALGRIAGRRTGILAHDRRPLPPGAFRASQRLIRMAGRFGLPLVTFVDTPGADPTSESEAGGVVRAIAGTFRDVLEHPRATVACVTGEGGSGGALAFACCDRVLALEHSIFSVIGPAGAAAILRRSDVASVAADLDLTSAGLARLGIADRVVAEPAPGAHAHPEEAARLLAGAMAAALDEASGADPRASRAQRWRAAANRFVEGL